MNEIKYEEAPEYLQPLAELEENVRIRNEVSVILRQLKIKNLENQFEAEELAAKQNLEVIIHNTNKSGCVPFKNKFRLFITE